MLCLRVAPMQGCLPVVYITIIYTDVYIPLVDVYVKREVWKRGGRKEGGREGMGEKGNCIIIESTCSDRDLKKGTLNIGMVWRNLSVKSHPCLHTLLGVPTSPFTF